MADTIIRPTGRILNQVILKTASEQDDVLIAGYEQVSVTADGGSGNGTWALQVTNDEDEDGEPQNLQDYVAANASIVKELTAGFRWLRLIFAKGTSTDGRAVIYGVRKFQ